MSGTPRKYVVAFNGPPGSGKDTAGQFAEKYLNFRGFEAQQMKYAAPLKMVVNSFLRVPFPELPHEDLKSQKIRISGMDFDATYRQAYIDFSEKFVKPLLGDDAFGKLMALDIADAWPDETEFTGVPAMAFVITDSGFENEQIPVIDLVGPTNYVVIRMHREGHDFKGDSRGYIRPYRGFGRDLHNNGTLEELELQVHAVLDDIIRLGKWH